MLLFSCPARGVACRWTLGRGACFRCRGCAARCGRWWWQAARAMSTRCSGTRGATRRTSASAASAVRPRPPPFVPHLTTVPHLASESLPGPMLQCLSNSRHEFRDARVRPVHLPPERPAMVIARHGMQTVHVCPGSSSAGSEWGRLQWGRLQTPTHRVAHAAQ